MSSLPESAAGRRFRRWSVVIGLAVLGAFLGWAFRDELAGQAARAAEWIHEAGPVFYFAAMAVVPLPLAWFTVPAGELFAAQLTMSGVIAAAMAAVLVQLSLSYAAARYGLRPVIGRWLQKRGHEVPKITRDNAVSVVLLVRLLPGPPMVLGSCILALAEAPFLIYLGLSALVALPWVCAGVVLGRGLLGGHFSQAAAGAGLMAALVIGVQLIKRRWRREGGERPAGR